MMTRDMSEKPVNRVQRYDDQEQKSAPEKIDIYVDACYLQKGKNNPLQTGGWAAVVIETYAADRKETRIISSQTPEHIHSSGEAENYAIAEIVRQVKERQDHQEMPPASPVKIVLHTDQKSLEGFVKNYRTNTHNENASIVWQNIAEMLLNIGATVQYVSHCKPGDGEKPTDNKVMDVVDGLAKQKASLARLEKQGAITLLGGKEYQSQGPESNEHLIKKLFPVDISALQGRSR